MPGLSDKTWATRDPPNDRRVSRFFIGGDETILAKPQRQTSPQRHWVYAYQIEPPQSDAQFAKVKTLLRRAHATARRAARMWAGRVVLQTRVTHIMIVSDSPSRRRAVNRALEAQLKRQGVRFSVSDAVVLQVAAR